MNPRFKNASLVSAPRKNSMKKQNKDHLSELLIIAKRVKNNILLSELEDVQIIHHWKEDFCAGRTTVKTQKCKKR